MFRVRFEMVIFGDLGKVQYKYFVFFQKQIGNSIVDLQRGLFNFIILRVYFKEMNRIIYNNKNQKCFVKLQYINLMENFVEDLKKMKILEFMQKYENKFMINVR